MLSRSKATIRSVTFAGAALAAALAGTVAIAQDLDQSVSCVTGRVEAFDYTELMENFKEGTWDKRGGVQLSSESEVINLQVLNLNNETVCDNTADLRTKCAFKLGLNTDFTVKVTNFENPVWARFRLCAY